MNQNQPVPSASSGGRRTSTPNNRKFRNDIIFIGGLLAVLVLCAFLIFLFGEEGDRVVVLANGEVYATYPLSKDTEVDIRTGENGEQLNRLVIREGKAFVESANCPQGRCVAHHPISYDFEEIVCLAHEVVITVKLGS